MRYGAKRSHGVSDTLRPARFGARSRKAATTCGGTNESWRDNRVHYFFAHVNELVDAGIAGMTFGTGAGGQTHLGTDGGQFKAAASAYMAAPVTL